MFVCLFFPKVSRYLLICCLLICHFYGRAGTRSNFSQGNNKSKQHPSKLQHLQRGCLSWPLEYNTVRFTFRDTSMHLIETNGGNLSSNVCFPSFCYPVLKQSLLQQCGVRCCLTAFWCTAEEVQKGKHPTDLTGAFLLCWCYQNICETLQQAQGCVKLFPDAQETVIQLGIASVPKRFSNTPFL